MSVLDREDYHMMSNNLLQFIVIHRPHDKSHDMKLALNEGCNQSNVLSLPQFRRKRVYFTNV